MGPSWSGSRAPAKRGRATAEALRSVAEALGTARSDEVSRGARSHVASPHRDPSRFRGQATHICYPSPTMAATKLTSKEITALRDRLLEERSELSEQLTTIEEDTFAATQSELSGDVGLDDEAADAGTATFEREKDLSIENNVRDLLVKISRALERIDAGTYGVCDRCGKTIEKARIKALPYVDLCIKDAQAQSRR